jgi:predicted RNA polymerase sigma factor
MVHGPAAGPAVFGTLDTDHRTAQRHRLEAVRAHLREQTGVARESYLRATRLTASPPEQHYLHLPSGPIRRSATASGRPLISVILAVQPC